MEEDEEDSVQLPWDSYSAEDIDIHVMMIPPLSWRRDLRFAHSVACFQSVSLGFIRVPSETKLAELRLYISEQLNNFLLPQNYILLRKLGRYLTWVNEKQEENFPINIFAPPVVVHPELYILDQNCLADEESLPILLNTTIESDHSAIASILPTRSTCINDDEYEEHNNTTVIQHDANHSIKTTIITDTSDCISGAIDDKKDLTLSEFKKDNLQLNNKETNSALKINEKSTKQEAENKVQHEIVQESNKEQETIGGNKGQETIGGNKGQETIGGNKAQETIGGNKGQETIGGNKGQETISGNKGQETISGNKGQETIGGNKGQDTIGRNKAQETIGGSEPGTILHTDNNTTQQIFTKCTQSNIGGNRNRTGNTQNNDSAVMSHTEELMKHFDTMPMTDLAIKPVATATNNQQPAATNIPTAEHTLNVQEQIPIMTNEHMLPQVTSSQPSIEQPSVLAINQTQLPQTNQVQLPQMVNQTHTPFEFSQIQIPQTQPAPLPPQMSQQLLPQMPLTIQGQQTFSQTNQEQFPNQGQLPNQGQFSNQGQLPNQGGQLPNQGGQLPNQGQPMIPQINQAHINYQTQPTLSQMLPQLPQINQAGQFPHQTINQAQPTLPQMNQIQYPQTNQSLVLQANQMSPAINSQPLFPQMNQTQPSFPQMNQTQPQFPQMNQTQPQFPQMNQTQPPFPQMNQTQPSFPQMNQTQPPFPQMNQTQQSFPQMNQTQQSFPQMNQTQLSFPQMQFPQTLVPQTTLPQMNQVQQLPTTLPGIQQMNQFPQANPSIPQIQQGLPQVQSIFPQMNQEQTHHSQFGQFPQINSQGHVTQTRPTLSQINPSQSLQVPSQQGSGDITPQLNMYQYNTPSLTSSTIQDNNQIIPSQQLNTNQVRPPLFNTTNTALHTDDERSPNILINTTPNYSNNILSIETSSSNHAPNNIISTRITAVPSTLNAAAVTTSSVSREHDDDVGIQESLDEPYNKVLSSHDISSKKSSHNITSKKSSHDITSEKSSHDITQNQVASHDIFFKESTGDDIVFMKEPTERHTSSSIYTKQVTNNNNNNNNDVMPNTQQVIVFDDTESIMNEIEKLKIECNDLSNVKTTATLKLEQTQMSLKHQKLQGSHHWRERYFQEREHTGQLENQMAVLRKANSSFTLQQQQPTMRKGWIIYGGEPSEITNLRIQCLKLQDIIKDLKERLKRVRHQLKTEKTTRQFAVQRYRQLKEELVSQQIQLSLKNRLVYNKDTVILA